MLAALHREGQLRKFATNEVEMTPDSNNVVGLDQLNEIIASQRGLSLEDLSIQPDSTPIKEENVVETPVQEEAQPVTQPDTLSDEDLAKQLRSQADALFKEAKALRDQAEELVPTKKRTTKKQEVVG